MEVIKGIITEFAKLLVETLRLSKFRNSHVVLFNDSAPDGLFCSETFSSLSRTFTSVIPNSTLTLFHLNKDHEQFFEYNPTEDKFATPPPCYFTEDLSNEPNIKFSKFTVTTKSTSISGFCLTNDKHM